MITPDIIVTELAVYLKNNQPVKVFKYENKPKDYVGEYIAVNNLPFSYGKVLNEDNIVNVNIHVPRLSSDKPDNARLNAICDDILAIVPFEGATEEKPVLSLNHAEYSVKQISQPIEDKDNTYFINLRVKITLIEI